MKKFIWTVALILVTSIGIKGQTNPQFNVTQYRSAFAKETLTVSNTVKTFTSSVYAPTANCGPTPIQCHADYAYVTVEADSMRYWPTGDDPTTTQGHKYGDGQGFYIFGYDNIKNSKMIRVTTDVTIQVSYYRFSSNTP